MNKKIMINKYVYILYTYALLFLFLFKIFMQ